MLVRNIIGPMIDAALKGYRQRQALLAPGIAAARIICESFPHDLDRGAIQKILFLCEMVERAHTNGKSGVVGSLAFCATDIGPLCEEIDAHLRARNTKAVRNFGVIPEHTFCAGTADRIRSVCHDIQKGFEKSSHRLFNGFLISHTHWQRGAWAKRYIPGCSVEISVADILEDFVNRRADRKAAAA